MTFISVDSISSFGFPLTSTRMLISVSNSPVDHILSLKKKKARKPRKKDTKETTLSDQKKDTIVTTLSDQSTEFSLPHEYPRRSKRKVKDNIDESSKKPRNDDDVFL